MVSTCSRSTEPRGEKRCGILENMSVLNSSPPLGERQEEFEENEYIRGQLYVLQWRLATYAPDWDGHLAPDP